MTVITAAGEVVRFSEATHGVETMSAVRLNLGLFGLIYDITLKVESDFNLEVTDQQMPLSLMREPNRVRDLVLNNYFCDVFWFPLSDALWVKTARRTEKAAISVTWIDQFLDKAHAWLGHIALVIMAKVPAVTRMVNQTALSIMVPEQKTMVREAAKAIHYKNNLEAYRCQLTFFAVKIDDDWTNPTRAWNLAMDRALDLAKNKQYPLTLMLQARFIGHSDALLSPAYGKPGEHYCYLELLSVRNTVGSDAFFNEITTQWMSDEGLQARPHWGKYFHSIPGIVPYLHRRMGSQIRRFNAVRETLDPNGMFLSSHLKRILYP